jgi:hypothetical protein
MDLSEYAFSSKFIEEELHRENQALTKLQQSDYSLLGGKSEQVAIIQEYLSDDLPDEFRKSEFVKRFWAFFSRSIKLSFFDSKFHPEILNLEFRNAKLKFLMSRPADEYSWKDSIDLDNLELSFISNYSRSIGTNENKINERTAPHHQMIRRLDSSPNSSQKLGFKQRILGRV